jgi:hypothetical protein
MKNTFALLFFAVVLIGCQKEVTATDIQKINGYWEIEKVIFADGTEKDYGINDTYDYFEIKGNEGFRKKVTPQIDGTFFVNEASEKVCIEKVNAKCIIHYTTSFAKWNEELVAVSDQELVTINEARKEYHYKKAGPINITGNGKKTQ